MVPDNSILDFKDGSVFPVVDLCAADIAELGETMITLRNEYFTRNLKLLSNSIVIVDQWQTEFTCKSTFFTTLEGHISLVEGPGVVSSVKLADTMNVEYGGVETNIEKTCLILKSKGKYQIAFA